VYQTGVEEKIVQDIQSLLLKYLIKWIDIMNHVKKLWSGLIIFGSVRFLLKKTNQTDFFLNRNRFKPTGFGSVRFFRTKTGSNRFSSVFSGFGSVFPVWLGFAQFVSGLARFFFFFSVWVRFGFFGFLLIKPKPNRLIFLKF
jgi:hypothetical protein